MSGATDRWVDLTGVVDVGRGEHSGRTVEDSATRRSRRSQLGALSPVAWLDRWFRSMDDGSGSVVGGDRGETCGECTWRARGLMTGETRCVWYIVGSWDELAFGKWLLILFLAVTFIESEVDDSSMAAISLIGGLSGPHFGSLAEWLLGSVGGTALSFVISYSSSWNRCRHLLLDLSNMIQ